MKHSLCPLPHGPAPRDPRRRIVLAGLLGAYAASLIPWALGQPVANAEQGAFLGVSAILAGRQTLDTTQAKRLYDALVANDAGFAAAAQALLTLINERKIDPADLHKVLTDEKSALAIVAQDIARAWFMGIVGSGEKSRALAYEDALNAQIVQDFLKPPTYAYGAYGSWAKQPTQGNPHG
ncbi:sugar dehydrogenase complex small subunit [Polaromonas hydrogenivorans]|uniref:Sugar dehydrogenase complex small subunit n=1 Tax=Polaromonas hydrogenivorans TaxID=335476 RepID=A0AAU7LZN0_9BURK